MADEYISDLTAASSVVSTMMFEVETAGATSEYVTAAQIATYVGGGISDGDKGDITVSSSGATWTIDAGVVSLSKMANMATASLLGRNTAGTGSPEVLSASTAKSLLSLNNVENTALSTWTGSTSITTLGTVATGTWNATAIGVSKGGTGLTATPTNGQLAIGNGSGYSLATLTAGSNITITNASGAITIAASGGGGGTPAGSDGEVQFSSAGSFGANSNFKTDVGGTSTALVQITAPSNTKSGLQVVTSGSGMTAPAIRVTDSSIDTFRVSRTGIISQATWQGGAIQLPYLGPTWEAEQTASFTAEVGKAYPLSLSGASAHRTVTLPATPSNGDRVAFYVSATTALYEWAFNRNGNTIRTGTSVDEFRLWAVGEFLVFRYLNSTWQIELDGRIPVTAVGSKTATQSMSHNTEQKWTMDLAITDGSVVIDTTNNRMRIRRKGPYVGTFRTMTDHTGTENAIVDCLLYLNGDPGTGTRLAEDFRGPTASITSGLNLRSSECRFCANLNAGDTVTPVIYQWNSAGMSRSTFNGIYTRMSLEERLQ